jgi:glycine/D-amino acid oxidase-like deaminating enzyme
MKETRSLATQTADIVIVGGGTIGGWASYFARSLGAERVVVLEQDIAGRGASSRAAGIVRAQGGTPATVRLGLWSINFYRSQQRELGIDSGFRELGYMLLATSERAVGDADERMKMQRQEGLEVSWLDARAAAKLNPTLSSEAFLGASYSPSEGAIDPPRNVLAYVSAMRGAGVELLEHTELTGLQIKSGADGPTVRAVETSAGSIATRHVLLTGGPGFAALGRACGIPVPVGGARHQVAVTEPHPAFDVDRQPMGFDVDAGLYWRLEEGGLLFGMSNPDEPPGEARELDWPYLAKMRRRLQELVPASEELGLRKAWAATIDYTPDHLPILGPGLNRDREPIDGVTVAAAGGHGMMWGPAVARAAADLALAGRTEVIDVTDLGLERFDDTGRSALQADPIALPFPPRAGD